jgi:hypothetical protein
MTTTSKSERAGIASLRLSPMPQHEGQIRIDANTVFSGISSFELRRVALDFLDCDLLL